LGHRLDFIFLQIPHPSNRYSFLRQLDFFGHPWFCSIHSLLSGPQLAFHQLGVAHTGRTIIKDINWH